MKNFKENIKNIIWDWNGTLLDDASTCISCMNSLLKERDLPLLSKDRYLEIFTFPVKDYYIRAGFNFEEEPFEIPAHQFIDLYRKEVLSSPLQENVSEVLSYLMDQGYMQAILSAMEKDFLLDTMSDKGIIEYFKAIYGIDNHLGAGKTLAARRMMQELNCTPDDTVIIGDTLHDAEIAEEIGIQCILVSNGHQAHDRLLKTGCTVMPGIEDVMKFF